MRRTRSLASIFFLITLLLLPQFGPILSAQMTPLSPQELDQLLSPIALYPDSLLSQIVTASTNPQEILDFDNWLVANQGLSGDALTDAAQQRGFDPAFLALAAFPQIIEMMAQHIDDYAAIGEAFSSDQAAVSDSIQRLRSQAYNAGSLQSNQQQTVVVQPGPQPIYVIQPTNPQMVYVPQYDPTAVYVRPATSTLVAASLITFGLGIGIGALIASNQPWGWGGWGWNWGARRVYYNRGYWSGWSNPYRPPRPWYRPRPIVWANRPGYRGNWRYRPNGYRPPKPNRPPVSGRPPWGPGNRPGSRPPSRPITTPVQPGRPRPTPGKPVTTPVQPGRPTRPTPTPRPNPNQPSIQPVKPGNPSRPVTRPTPTPQPSQPKPAQPSRPAVQPKPTPQPAQPSPQPTRPAPPPNRPSTQPSRPTAQPRTAPQARPQPQKPAAPPKPAPQTPPPQPN
jgi:Protein of unknown function (DUF3300)